MKHYLITLLPHGEIKSIHNFYNGWENIGDTHKNLEIYNTIEKSGIDVIGIFGKILENANGEFGDITGPNIYVTQEGIYYYDSIGDTFKLFSPNSHVYFLRIKDIDIEYLSFLKEYAKLKWNMYFHFSYEFQSSYIHTKQFGMYYGHISGTEKYIPKSMIPLLCETTDTSLIYRFLQDKNILGKKIILKTIGGSGGEGIFIFDSSSVGTKINYNGLFNLFENTKIKKVICMELIDTVDYEIRLLWVRKSGNIEIVKMFKKVRNSGEILHNISQGNTLENIEEIDIPYGLIDNVVKFCLSLPDKHGGLDIILSKEGEYYFTENNTLTGYLDTKIEKPILTQWFEKIAKSYVQ